ncbi:hypothetical protein KHA80_20570 [Anaerobacillus sp. HL2]|nr:hypothetical protein KHA80_20570 [Anaerobacillus sp. HL2]
MKEDQRPIISRPIPKNKITEAEKMLEIVKQKEFVDLPPSQKLYQKLADQNIYIAS